MTINDRIALIIREKNLNPNSFSALIGVNSTVIHNILKGRNKPSYDILTKILKTVKDLNPEWLMNGTEEMFKESMLVLYLKLETSLLPRLTKIRMAFDVLKVSGVWEVYNEKWKYAHTNYEAFNIEIRNHMHSDYDNIESETSYHSKLKEFYKSFMDEYLFLSNLLAAIIIDPSLKNRPGEFQKFMSVDPTTEGKLIPVVSKPSKPVKSK